MKKIKEVYRIDIDDNLDIEFEINERGNVVITKAEEMIYHEELDYDEHTYCKPNIKFTILPQYDVEEQVRYHLVQRDRTNRIKKRIEDTKEMLRKRNIR